MAALPVALGVCAGAAALWVATAVATGRFAVENARYVVARRAAGFEVRDVPAHWRAEFAVPSGARDAGSAGFRGLAGYIFGGTATGERIAMTTPVAFSAATAGAPTVVAFVLPAVFDGEHAPPAPRDPRVQLRLVRAARIAAAPLWLRGANAGSALGGERFAAAAAALRAAVSVDGAFEAAGEISQLSYDPPWTPFFMRRDEVVVAVIDAAPGSRHE